MSGKLSRNKGAAWEREVANRLTQATGVDCKRCLIESQQGNSGDIVTALPYSIQCKVGASPNPIGAFLEASESAEPGEEPIAIIRKHAKRSGFGPPPRPVDVAVIGLEHLLRLLALEKKYGESP